MLRERYTAFTYAAPSLNAYARNERGKPEGGSLSPNVPGTGDAERATTISTIGAGSKAY
ncbi:MAG: hypothetical protein HYU04_02010 [Candidatus Wildermuthbacteria bacterium]|nr:hypothetical protein [Candidatus Wildermuthbacteria bacterium]